MKTEDKMTGIEMQLNTEKGLNVKVFEIYKCRTHTYIFFTLFSIAHIL